MRIPCATPGKSHGIAMPKDARRQRDLIAALHLETAFNSAQLGFTKAEEAGFLRPAPAENERAVATPKHANRQPSPGWANTHTQENK